MRLIIIFSLMAACGGRPVPSDAEQLTELELLCESWCETQSACGFSSDYSPEGQCLANCAQSRGWDIAWESICQDETRSALSCLSDSACVDLTPMFDTLDEGPSPCVVERSAVLTCSSD
jgi:hypothetical protein